MNIIIRILDRDSAASVISVGAPQGKDQLKIVVS